MRARIQLRLAASAVGFPFLGKYVLELMVNISIGMCCASDVIFCACCSMY
jgi:hypothetical protein